MKEEKLQPVSQKYSHKWIPQTILCQKIGQPRRND